MHNAIKHPRVVRMENENVFTHRPRKFSRTIRRSARQWRRDGGGGACSLGLSASSASLRAHGVAALWWLGGVLVTRRSADEWKSRASPWRCAANVRKRARTETRTNTRAPRRTHNSPTRTHIYTQTLTHTRVCVCEFCKHVCALYWSLPRPNNSPFFRPPPKVQNKKSWRHFWFGTWYFCSELRSKHFFSKNTLNLNR